MACALFDWGAPKGFYHAWGGFSPTDGATIGGGILVQVVGILAIAAWTAITLTLVPPGAACLLRSAREVTLTFPALGS